MTTFQQLSQNAWTTVLHRVFGPNIPNTAQWTNLQDIIQVLNDVGSVKKSNHTFCPGGGGFDLREASTSVEPGCIEMDFGVTCICKPRSLDWVLVGNDIFRSYFRLELDQLQPSGVYPSNGGTEEEVTDMGNGRYNDRSVWDQGQGVRPISRQFSGSYVIFCKASNYNQDSSTYDGRHNIMTAVQFEQLIRANY